MDLPILETTKQKDKHKNQQESLVLFRAALCCYEQIRMQTGKEVRR